MEIKIYNANNLFTRHDYIYQNVTYKGGVIFDFWSCGPAEKDSKKKKFAGAYPSGFLKRWKRAFAGVMPKYRQDVLHFCAGRVPASEGLRLDIDNKYKPTYCENVETFAENHPELHNKFRWTLSDSPYNADAAKRYYNMNLLNKRKMFISMIRVTKVGGFIGVLDQTFPSRQAIRNIKTCAIIAVTSVPNTDVRLFSVFQKIFSDEKFL